MVMDGDADLKLRHKLVQAVERIGRRVGRDVSNSGSFGKLENASIGCVILGKAADPMGVQLDFGFGQQFLSGGDLVGCSIECQMFAVKLSVMQAHALDVTDHCQRVECS